MKAKNGLAEAIGGKEKHLSVFYVKSLGSYHMIQIESINPGLLDSQSFTPMQHHILSLILFSSHLYPQMPSFSFLSPALGPPYKDR